MIKINLLPRDRQKEKGDTKRIFILIAILVYCIMAASYIWLWQQETQIKDEINRLEIKLNSKKYALNKLKKAKQEQAEISQKITTIANLLKENPILIKNIEITTKNIPYQQIFLSKIQADQASISINAFAADLKSIATYIRKLEKQDEIKKVELTNTKQKEINGEKLINFTLKIGTKNEN
ncbi:PilN domain-containing protein [Thermodesulfatator atlanticus]|uniref:PilN domain-containing protein n=1 Tax=Thermodesulfatator atlanticus TaxID=501497 RepID=UPI0003B3AE5F|nr:PilN domain-containing protein [Thermodesulfatator atlanticus]